MSLIRRKKSTENPVVDEPETNDAKVTDSPIDETDVNDVGGSAYEMDKEESVLYAQKYLEDLLSFFGANLTVSSTCEDDVIELSVPSNMLNSLLIGRNAETLRSLQYIVSTVLRNRGGELTRVNIDIADYKKQRADRIAKQAVIWIEEVRRTGDSKILDLNAADRRIVHRVASEYSDIKTFSEGEGRDRKLTIAQESS